MWHFLQKGKGGSAVQKKNHSTKIKQLQILQILQFISPLAFVRIPCWRISLNEQYIGINAKTKKKVSKQLIHLYITTLSSQNQTSHGL